MSLKGYLAAASAFAVVAVASDASASTCIGACGALGPDGVVTAPPGGSTYGYVTTNGGVVGAGEMAGVGGLGQGDNHPNGSEFITNAFALTAGSNLELQFNYITSDAGVFSDYAFAELLTDSDTHVAWLFTARTTDKSGNTIPGAGLEKVDAKLKPSTTKIIGGGPEWSPLGADSGDCFQDLVGCGYTGWVQSDYTVDDAGLYKLRFGVTNVFDTGFNSGLAFAGDHVDGLPTGGVGSVPEPAAWTLLLAGFFGAGSVLRLRKARPI